MTNLADRELVLTRLIDAPVEKVWACWTQPDLIKLWFAPRPWTTPRVESDFRVGGSSLVVMADEAGNEYPNPGQYLVIEPLRRLVFTDAYIGDWTPSEKPFFTADLSFADEGGKTRYTARAIHWTVEDKQAHEKMGFHEGWGLCAGQLEAVAKSI